MPTNLSVPEIADQTYHARERDRDEADPPAPPR
jgi:hypothetical protein